MRTPYEIGRDAALEKIAVAPLLGAAAAAAPWLARVGPWAARVLPSLGKDMAIGGLMTGGINAMTAEKGDRMSAFGRGLVPGAVGGAVFRGAVGGANMLRGVRDPATKMFSGGPMSNYLNQSGFKPWLARQATRPGVLGLAATWKMPTGAAKPDPMPMTNIPGMV